MRGPLTSIITSLTALATAASAQNVSTSVLTFPSGGQRIRLEVFTPRQAKRAPAVLMLHGAGGVDAGNHYVRQLAEAMAAQGFATLLLHYFDRTNTTWASDATIYKNFDTWVETIRDGVNFAMAHPGLDTERIGVVGYSLGGYLAVAAASQDTRIKAVVELAGGIAPEMVKGVQKLPPTMVVHGEADQRVPFKAAKDLQMVLRRLQTPHETRFYPGEGHILSPLAALDALSRGVDFLRRYLLPNGPAPAPAGG